MFGFLKKSVNQNSQKDIQSSQKDIRHTVNENMIIAKVANHHMSKHSGGGMKMHLLQCHFEYDKGDKAVVGVPWSKDNEQSCTMYMINILTGEIEDCGGMSLPK